MQLEFINYRLIYTVILFLIQYTSKSSKLSIMVIVVVKIIDFI